MKNIIKKMIAACILSVGFDASLQAESLIKESVTPKKQYLMPTQQYMVGYNVSPLLHREKNNARKQDISFDVSYLSYYASEDGLDLANSAAVITSGGSTGAILSTGNSIGLMQDFTFNSGFKAGMGVSCRTWNLNAEYTWIRQSTFTNAQATTPDTTDSIGVWVLNNWFTQLSSLGQTISTTDISSQWNLGMDFADLTMGHAYYEGRYLSVVPFFGVRGAWIRQSLDLAITIPSDVVFDVVRSPIDSLNSSNSWAFGPRTGFDASWLFKYGLRIDGSAGANLLFTQYRNVQHSEQLASSSTGQLSSQLSNVNCLRPELDCSIGLGWGQYIEDRCYVDFSIK